MFALRGLFIASQDDRERDQREAGEEEALRERPGDAVASAIAPMIDAHPRPSGTRATVALMPGRKAATAADVIQSASAAIIVSRRSERTLRGLAFSLEDKRLVPGAAHHLHARVPGRAAPDPDRMLPAALDEDAGEPRLHLAERGRQALRLGALNLAAVPSDGRAGAPHFAPDVDQIANRLDHAEPAPSHGNRSLSGQARRPLDRHPDC